MSIIRPFIEVVGSAVFGLVLGLLFLIPLRYFKKDSNRLIITTAFVFFGSALASILSLSPLLLCMCMGATLVNISSSANHILKLSDSITPPIFLMFFVVSGMQLDISILPKIGFIGITYILVRAIGKVSGAYLGSKLMKAPDVITKYLGFSLIPQAGVAIGLALTTARLLPQYGATIQAVVLGATFVYEIVGPVMTKVSLQKAGEITQ